LKVPVWVGVPDIEALVPVPPEKEIPAGAVVALAVPVQDIDHAPEVLEEVRLMAVMEALTVTV